MGCALSDGIECGCRLRHNLRVAPPTRLSQLDLILLSTTTKKKNIHYSYKFGFKNSAKDLLSKKSRGLKLRRVIFSLMERNYSLRSQI